MGYLFHMPKKPPTTLTRISMTVARRLALFRHRTGRTAVHIADEALTEYLDRAESEFDRNLAERDLGNRAEPQ